MCDLQIAHAKKENMERTERRTPNPAKITFAGEKTCQMSIRPGCKKFVL
jgi:hypothetical protein